MLNLVLCLSALLMFVREHVEHLVSLLLRWKNQNLLLFGAK